MINVVQVVICKCFDDNMDMNHVPGCVLFQLAPDLKVGITKTNIKSTTVTKYMIDHCDA